METQARASQVKFTVGAAERTPPTKACGLDVDDAHLLRLLHIFARKRAEMVHVYHRPLVPKEHLFGTFFVQSRAQLGTAHWQYCHGHGARGIWYLVHGSKQSVSPAHCTRARWGGSIPHCGSALLGTEGTLNGVVLLPPQ
jgi:hypothetical protein